MGQGEEDEGGGRDVFLPPFFKYIPSVLTHSLCEKLLLHWTYSGLKDIKNINNLIQKKNYIDLFIVSFTPPKICF